MVQCCILGKCTCVKGEANTMCWVTHDQAQAIHPKQLTMMYVKWGGIIGTYSSGTKSWHKAWKWPKRDYYVQVWAHYLGPIVWALFLFYVDTFSSWAKIWFFKWCFIFTIERLFQGFYLVTIFLKFCELLHRCSFLHFSSFSTKHAHACNWLKYF